MGREFSEYPKWKYKEGEAPRLLQTSSEEGELGENWFDKPDMTNHTVDIAKAAQSAHQPGYEPVEYPKWRYAKEIPGGKLVNSEAEEDGLEDAYPEIVWYDKPDYTDHGDDSTDTTSASLYTNAANNPPFDALTGDKALLKPVPEMKQGKAAQKASAIVETKEGDDDEEDEEDDEDDDNAEDGGTEPVEGEGLNNFDQANGVNPGDAAPEGNNPNGPTGKVSGTETEKQTAEESKKPDAKKSVAKKPAAKRASDDLL